MAVYWGIAAHSAYYMFSWYKYLSVFFSFFPPLSLWSGNFFLIAPFPDHCLLTGCFLRPDIKRFCLTFTIGPDRIWFCLIVVSDFFLQ